MMLENRTYPSYEDEKEFTETENYHKEKAWLNCDGYKQAHLKRQAGGQIEGKQFRIL